MNIKCQFKSCKKKINISQQISCKCGFIFCKIHRPSVEHNCSFDYKKEFQEKLKKQNPIVISNKVDKI